MTTRKNLPKNIQHIYSALSKKSFGVKDIKRIDADSVRQLRYWISLNLVFGSQKNEAEIGWDKFNFFEFLWVLIIRELKELNFDNDIILKCANELNSRKDQSLNITEFEKAILYSIKNRKEVFFVVDKDGDFAVYRTEDLGKIANKKEFKTSIVMNLLLLIKSFLSNANFTKFIVDSGLLRESEINALMLLQGDKTSEVRILSEKGKVSIRPGQSSLSEFIEAVFAQDYKSISIDLN